MTRKLRAAGFACLTLSLLGAKCGDGPTPGSTATPTPAMTATPTPTPTPTSSPAPSIAGLRFGETIQAAVSCADGAFTFTAGRISQVTALATPSERNGSAGNGLAIRYDAIDTFHIGLGFDDIVQVVPAQKLIASPPWVDYFAGPGYSFEMTNQLFTNGVVGRLYSDSWKLCFFAGGTPTQLVSAQGVSNLMGLADGLALIGGDDRRLYGSGASATYNLATRTVDVILNLRPNDDPFGSYFPNPSPSIGQATARLTLPAGTGYFPDAPLTGPNGATGTISGMNLPNLGVALVFKLDFPNGDRAIGSAVINND